MNKTEAQTEEEKIKELRATLWSMRGLHGDDAQQYFMKAVDALVAAEQARVQAMGQGGDSTTRYSVAVKSRLTHYRWMLLGDEDGLLFYALEGIQKLIGQYGLENIRVFEEIALSDVALQKEPLLGATNLSAEGGMIDKTVQRKPLNLPPQWIPTDDAFPGEDGNYKVRCGDDELDEDYWNSTEFRFRNFHNTVTHWWYPGKPQNQASKDKVEITPENYWRDVWHTNCQSGRCGSPMKHLTARLSIEDGSELRLYECTGCGVRVFAGLDTQRFVVTRPTEITNQ